MDDYDRKFWGKVPPSERTLWGRWLRRERGQRTQADVIADLARAKRPLATNTYSEMEGRDGVNDEHRPQIGYIRCSMTDDRLLRVIESQQDTIARLVRLLSAEDELTGLAAAAADAGRREWLGEVPSDQPASPPPPLERHAPAGHTKPRSQDGPRE